MWGAKDRGIFVARIPPNSLGRQRAEHRVEGLVFEHVKKLGQWKDKVIIVVLRSRRNWNPDLQN